MENLLFYQFQANEIPQINVTETVIIKPPYIHFRRKANEYILYYVLSGEMHLMEGEELYILRQDDIIILDPSHEHYGVKATTCNFIYLHFNVKNMKEVIRSTEELKSCIRERRTQMLSSQELNQGDIILPKYYHIKDNASAVEIISRLGTLQKVDQTVLEHRKLQAGCLLLELLVILSREYISEFLYQKNATTINSVRTVYEIISFLETSYSSDISGSLLEEQFNCNFDYINRIFKSMFGKTIFTYLNGLRVEKAKQFLSTRIYSLSDVAEKTGFHDVYYFAKVFKKFAGVTPGAYIKQIK